jgi:hypothetical protein
MTKHLCGAPTLKGGKCKNPVSEDSLLCHHHIGKANEPERPSLQTLITEVATRKEMPMLATMLDETNKGYKEDRGMHYLLMDKDEYGNPVVLSRVFSNVEEIPFTANIPEGAALVPSDIGNDYAMAFMSEFFGDIEYWVEYYPVASNVNIAKDFPHAALAWADESMVTVITLPEYPFWGALEKIGLKVNPGPKLAKRLKALVAVKRYFRRMENHELDIMVFDTEDDVPVEHYDGQTIVRRSFLEKTARTQKDRMVLRHEAKNGYIQLLTEGLFIKGDFIVAHNDSDIPADVVTHSENVKSEISLENNGTWVAINLHHDHHAPVTDVQSLSWMGEVVFPADRLEEELRRVGASVISDLRDGIFPRYMESYADSDGDFSYDDPGVIKDMRAMYNRWTSEGYDLNQAAYFLHTIGTGFLNKMRSGVKFPIPWAVYGHVTTHEMLEMAGYNVSAFDGVVFYHDATGRISYPGDLFKALFPNHGGWDLDDSVRIMVRNFGEDGVKGISLRSPNAYGEYSIIPIDLDSFLPVLYNVDGELPDLSMTVEEFKKVLPPIQVVNRNVRYKGMPESTASFEKYEPSDAQVVINAMKESPGVGSWANSQMVYYGTHRTFRRNQLAPTEDIVDTLTQSTNAAGFTAVTEDINSTWGEIVSGGRVERYFISIDKRVPKKVADEVVPFNGYLTQLAVAHRTYMDRFAEILVKLSNHERKPIHHEILDMEVSEYYMNRAADAEKWFRGLADKAPKRTYFDFQEVEGDFAGASRLVKVRESRKFWQDANRKAVKTILNSDDPTQFLVAIYRYSEMCRTWKRNNGIDRILFAPNHEGEASVMDLFISMLRSEIG